MLIREIDLDNLPEKIGYGDYAVADLCSADKLVDWALKKYKYKIATIHHADFSRHNVLGKAGIDDDDETIIEYLICWHVTERKFNGIGYHFIIVPDGRLLLTYRGIVGKQGAHVRGHNPNNLGVLIWGDFEIEHPTIYQIAMTRILKACLREKSDIENYYGHKELLTTFCPGKNFPLRIWH